MDRYRDFREEDFIKDENFQKWVKDPENEEANAFWDAFIDQFPHKKEQIERARKFVLMMNFKEMPVSDKEIHLLKKRIDESISYPVMIPYDYHSINDQKGSSLKKYVIAAVVALFIVSVGVMAFLDGTRLNEELLSTDNVGNLEEQVSQKGKRSVIVLEDGTKVWLNADSKITYNKDFIDFSKREVFLKGEAFFEVAKDPDKPFIVHTSSIIIRVTGTSFNVKSYDKDDFVETTLLEGKVIIALNDKKNTDAAPPIETTLLPNQQARFDKKSKKIELENRVEAKEYSEWRSGKLYFEDRPITEVFSMLERWYDVDIHLENQPQPSCLFSAKLDNMTLEEVLELFKISDDINYEINDDEVFISGTLCEE